MAKKADLIVLRTKPEVIEALGGYEATSKLTGATYNNVLQWPAADKFPARYCIVMLGELERRGYTASPKLWGQVLPNNWSQSQNTRVLAIAS
jgi:hypothetical protein